MSDVTSFNANGLPGLQAFIRYAKLFIDTIRFWIELDLRALDSEGNDEEALYPDSVPSRKIRERERERQMRGDYLASLLMSLADIEDYLASDPERSPVPGLLARADQILAACGSIESWSILAHSASSDKRPSGGSETGASASPRTATSLPDPSDPRP